MERFIQFYLNSNARVLELTIAYYRSAIRYRTSNPRTAGKENFIGMKA